MLISAENVMRNDLTQRRRATGRICSKASARPMGRRIPAPAKLITPLLALALGGCPPTPDRPAGYLNQTDPTNGGAAWLGGNACTPCHTEQAARHALTEHATTGFATENPLETGVQCESCHGPAGAHFTTVDALDGGREVVVDRARIFVDPDGRASCFKCHATPPGDETGAIAATEDGFIARRQQVNELLNSGGHAGFACIICHDPHRSVVGDRGGAIRNECSACHADMSMAGHGGDVFVRGEFSEALTCESCHMPYATRDQASLGLDDVGPRARVGDTRTHIFRINPDPVDFRAFFTGDLSQVRRDELGRAAVTVDFVCLRCHNGLGSVFALTLERAAEIAGQVHRLP